MCIHPLFCLLLSDHTSLFSGFSLGLSEAKIEWTWMGLLRNTSEVHAVWQQKPGMSLALAGNGGQLQPTQTAGFASPEVQGMMQQARILSCASPQRLALA
jgi:hypothetical protein